VAATPSIRWQVMPDRMDESDEIGSREAIRSRYASECMGSDLLNDKGDIRCALTPFLPRSLLLLC
jgi:hypothetical protein